MRSDVTRPQKRARNALPSAAGTALGHRARLRPAFAVAMVLALAGCACEDWEPYDVSLRDSDAAASKPRRAKARASAMQMAKLPAEKPQAAKAKIPLPASVLLTPQADPRCEESRTTASLQPAKADAKKVTSTDAGASSPGATETAREKEVAATPTPAAPAEANKDLALRIKLEYERECYRQAERRARNRLGELQKSVGATIKAVEAQSP